MLITVKKGRLSVLIILLLILTFTSALYLFQRVEERRIYNTGAFYRPGQKSLLLLLSEREEDGLASVISQSQQYLGASEELLITGDLPQAEDQLQLGLLHLSQALYYLWEEKEIDNDLREVIGAYQKGEEIFLTLKQNNRGELREITVRLFLLLQQKIEEIVSKK